MTRNLVAALVLAAVTAVIWAFQSWLEARHFDRTELALISGLTGSLIALVVLLVLQLGSSLPS
jgi:uncharacterized membrane protein